MPFNHLFLCRLLLLPPSIPPSIRVFSNESVLHMRWPKYWSFSFIIIPSNEHPGLISFRMDWLDLLAVQGTLKSLLQHHSSKASILWRSAFFISTVINNVHEVTSHDPHNRITCAVPSISSVLQGRNLGLKTIKCVQDHKTNNWRGWGLNPGNVSLKLASIKWGKNWKHITKRHNKSTIYKNVSFL